MTGSFCVDIDRLGQIPDVVATARRQLLAAPEELASQAAGAIPGGGGVDRLAMSLMRFQGAAGEALTDDMVAIDLAKLGYVQCDLDAAAGAKSIGKAL